MKRLLTIILFVIIFTPFHSGYNLKELNAQESRILITQVASLDVFSLLQSIEENIDYQIYLIKMEETYQEESDEIETNIQSLEEYIQLNYTNLTAEKIAEIEQEIAFQKLQIKEILLGDKTEEKSDQIILKSLYRLVKEVAEREGYSMVIDKSSAVVYSKDEIDITKDILDLIEYRSKQ